jgi:glycosyltransferase involved in cell wall biosynthesis
VTTPLTIVLPTFDRRHVLERTIACYRDLARRHPLLVVDDGSHDGTAGWLAREGIRVVRHSRRRGLPAARNTGLRLADTPWVLFGEDDVLMPPDHPERLLDAAVALPRVGAVAGRLFPGTGWSLPDSVPGDAPGALLDGSRLGGDFAAALPLPRPLPSLHACALVDRRAALAVGGYDESLFDSAYREESDLYARLWRAGRASWLTPTTWAVHVRHRLGGGARGRAGLAGKLRNRWSYWRNDCRFIDRHARLWRRWTDGPGPGAMKGASAATIAGHALRAGIGR